MGDAVGFQQAGRGDDTGIVTFRKDDAPFQRARTVFQPVQYRVIAHQWLCLISEKPSIGSEGCDVVKHGLDSGSDGDGQQQARRIPKEAPEHE